MDAGKIGSFRGCLREVYRTRVWLLLLSRAIIFASIFIAMPHIQTELTDYFKRNHTDEDIECTGHHHEDRDEQPEPCKRAHTDVMIWTTGRTMFSAFTFALFLNPAVGTWSDMFGRKRFLVCSYVMHLVPLLVVLLYLRTGLELYWYFPAYVVSAAVNAGSLCLAYIADLISEEHRILAFGALNLMMGFGIMGGTALTVSGLVKSLETACFVGVGLCVVATVLVVVSLPESLSHELQLKARTAAAEKPTSFSCSQSLAFSWASFRSAVKILWRTSLFRKLTTIMFIVALVAEEYIEFKTQYLQEVLDFGTAEQAMMMMIMGVSSILITTVGLWLAKPVLRLTDKQILTLGSSVMMVSFVLLAAAQSAWMAYLSTGLVSFWMFLSIAISSMKSANVEAEEQGAVQGALSAVSSVGFGLGPLLFLSLFVAFRHGAVYLPGAPFYFASFLIFIAVCISLSIKPPTNRTPSEVSLEKAEEREPLIPEKN